MHTHTYIYIYIHIHIHICVCDCLIVNVVFCGPPSSKNWGHVRAISRKRSLVLSISAARRCVCVHMCISDTSLHVQRVSFLRSFQMPMPFPLLAAVSAMWFGTCRCDNTSAITPSRTSTMAFPRNLPMCSLSLISSHTLCLGITLLRRQLLHRERRANSQWPSRAIFQ